MRWELQAWSVWLPTPLTQGNLQSTLINFEPFLFVWSTTHGFIVVWKRCFVWRPNETLYASSCLPTLNYILILFWVGLSNHGDFIFLFSHDVTAAIIVPLNKATPAMIVSRTNPQGIELYILMLTFSSVLTEEHGRWLPVWKTSNSNFKRELTSYTSRKILTTSDLFYCDTKKFFNYFWSTTWSFRTVAKLSNHFIHSLSCLSKKVPYHSRFLIRKKTPCI